MNILKIKLTLLSVLCITITSINKSTAQDNFIDDPNGGIIKSDGTNFSNLFFKNQFDVELGRIANRNTGAFTIYNRGSVVFNSKLNQSLTLGSGDAKIIQKADGRVSIASTGTIAQGLFKDENNDEITSYSLFVEKGVLTEKCKIAVKELSDWSDYVFEEDYERMPLNELEDFVTENKHLPKVPSAEEMVENGLDVAKMDAKLLEKIEEAYLYIIDLNKKVDALANENESLKTSLQSISISGK